jgi:hypothetical protein
MVKAKRGADDPSPWQNSVAKALLRKDILDGKVVDSMKPKEVFQMRMEYAAYSLDKFRQYLSTLRESIKRGADDPSPWQNSAAKALLRKDILDGKVVDSMKPKEVFQMRMEYAAYDLDKFRANLSSLRESIKLCHAKADSDSTDLAKDRRTRPPPTHTSKGYPRWDGSAAARFIKEDADKGLLQQLKPAELRETR